MSDDTDRRADWAVARLLLSTHLPFWLIMWFLWAAIIGVVILVFAVFGTLTHSVWDRVANVPWLFALGYGFYLSNRLLPLYVAHGHTRRNAMAGIALFVLVTAGALALLMTLGYALEAAIFRAMDWPQELSAHRIFSSPTEFMPIFVTFLVLFGVWVTIGAMLAAGFYRSDVCGLVTIIPGLVLVALVNLATGFDSLPFVLTLFAGAEVSLPGAAVVGAGGLLLGAAVTWAIVRDIPLRNKSA